MKKDKIYWFAAKRYGWGWKLPSKWQGWMTLLVYLTLMILLPSFIDPSSNLISFIISISVVSLLFVAICYCKGEPPKWRWGDSK